MNLISPAQSATAAGTALVTGAGKRLGRAIALGLAAAGWDVVVHYRNSATDALSAVAQIQAMGRRACAISADLAEPAEAADLFAAAQQALGPVQCLVNSASRFELDQPATFSWSAFESHARPNLAAPLLLAQALFQAAEQGQYDAVVINLLDQKLDNLNPDFFSYTLTKASLLAATKMMAMSFAPRVRVNGVSPGATLPAWRQSSAGFEAANKIALLQHSSQPEDIVQAVVYLAQAKAVTGVNLIVDGGQHLMSLSRDVMFLTEQL